NRWRAASAPTGSSRSRPEARAPRPGDPRHDRPAWAVATAMAERPGPGPPVSVVSMRVIAGRLGGRRLTAPRGKVTRPTSDRVRESLFALLGELEGESVLDLFAGAGGLGIEALSRGAAAAVFVESDGAAVKALRANLAALELHPEIAQVRREGVLVALRTAKAREETYDLVFI